MAHVALVLGEEIFLIELVEEISQVLEVAELAGGAQEGVLADLAQPPDILPPRLRAVGSEGVRSEKDPAVVLHGDDGGALYNRLEGVLLWLEGELAGHGATMRDSWGE